MRIIRHISLALALSLILVSCSGDKGRVIPRAKLAQIYAEMFMVDQWISSNHSIRRQADTSLVYEPILDKYGYTSADYRRSVNKYMDDPERYSRILRTTGQILDDKLAELNLRQEEILRLRAIKEFLEEMRYEADFKAEEFFPYLFAEPYVHYYDSLDVKPDSTLMVYRLINIDRADTLYDGLRMILKDSLAVKDTLMATDSRKVQDSLVVEPAEKPMDSIPVKRILPRPMNRTLNKKQLK